MSIVKKINNNVAMARDDRGNELVVFGKGIGFHETPYYLEDESTLQAVFSNINNGILSMVRTVPSEVIDAALQIIDMAKAELDCELNPNVVLTLADHLQFAVERLKDGCVIENPLSDTVEFVYPVEHGLGLRALAILKKETGVSMPRTEACSIAMHLVNSERADGRVDDMDEVMRTLSSIDEVTNIVEREFGITVDRASYNYARFTTHLRYLIKRLKADRASSDSNADLFARISHDFPDVSACADAIASYLEDRFGRACSEEERLYLMMYINRFLASR